jgi:hypothetical protein
MRRDELRISVAPTNGRPQRLVIVEHRTRGSHRDNLDTNSATSRARFIGDIAKRFSENEANLEWINQALIEAADEADHRADEAASAVDDREQKSTADMLVDLALERYRIGRSDADEAFAVERHGPNLAIMFRGSREALRSTLAHTYRELHGRTPNSTALADSLTVLAGEAYAATPEPVHLRVAEHEGSIIIDLGDGNGQAVVVRAGTWHVVECSPVVFRRTAATGALPVPQRGGDLAQLQAMLNVSPDTWPLVLGWLVAALVPNIPHPILLLGGQQGTGKTTAAEQLVGLIDPSPAVLRSPPRDSETWAISASASWVVGVDNVSTIPDWWSDSLCKAVTGDGWLRRKLYTDGELAVLSFRRVVLLTSIDPGALRGDLGDRVLLVDLEPIDEAARSTRRGIETRYQSARPRLFGALLDLLARIWRELPSVHLEKLPRMADFAQLLAAMDCVRSDGCALDIYLGQRERIAETVIESDPVALAIRALIGAERCWEGTAAELLARLTPEKPPKDWPRTPQGLGGKLKRLIDALNQTGIDVTYLPRTDSKGTRRICLTKDGDSLSESSELSEIAEICGSDNTDDTFPNSSNDHRTVLPSRLRGLSSGRLEDGRQASINYGDPTVAEF